MANRSSVRIKRKRDAVATTAAAVANVSFAADKEVAIEQSKLHLAAKNERLKAELAEAQEQICRLHSAFDDLSDDIREMGATNVYLQRECDKTTQEVTEEVRAQNIELLQANDVRVRNYFPWAGCQLICQRFGNWFGRM